MNYTPDKITSLAPHEVFVFGSNLAGVHGAGAARLAIEEFGAVMGVGEGLRGQSYALPTKDAQIETLPIESVAEHIATFLRFAELTPDLVFLVTQVGCGLAGYKVEDIGPLFFRQAIPFNVVLPVEFWRAAGL